MFVFRSSWVLCLVVTVDQKPSPPTVKCCFLGVGVGGGVFQRRGEEEGKGGIVR